MDRAFMLVLHLGNDAMQTTDDVARALEKVAARLRKAEYPVEDDVTRGVSDENGNTVGAWRLCDSAEVPD